MEGESISTQTACMCILLQSKAGWKKGGHGAIVMHSKTRSLPQSQSEGKVLCGETWSVSP